MLRGCGKDGFKQRYVAGDGFNGAVIESQRCKIGLENCVNREYPSGGLLLEQK